MNDTVKKIISSILLVAFLSTGAFFHVPKAKALVPVPTWDGAANAVLGIISGTEISNLGQDILEWIQEIALTIAKRLAITLLQQVILEGVLGDGNVVVDFKALFEEAGLSAINAFNEKIDDINFCSYFGSEIKQAFGGAGSVGGFVFGQFSNAVRCTTGSIGLVSKKDFADFSNDFNVAGFTGLIALVAPENNPITSYLNASSKAFNLAEKEVEAIKTEVLPSGFLGKRECDGDNCIISTPSKTIQDIVNNVFDGDFKFLASAEGIPALLGAIANVFINKVIQEGLVRLNALVNPDDVDKAISNFDETNAAILAEGKDNAVQRIDEVIDIRADIIAAAGAGEGWWQGYVDELAAFKAKVEGFIALGNTSCSAAAFGPKQSLLALKAEIDAALLQAENRLTTIQDQVVDNQNIITELTGIRAEVATLENTHEDRIRLAQILTQLGAKLDAGSAANELQQAEIDRDQAGDLYGPTRNQFLDKSSKCTVGS